MIFAANHWEVLYIKWLRYFPAPGIRRAEVGSSSLLPSTTFSTILLGSMPPERCENILIFLKCDHSSSRSNHVRRSHGDLPFHRGDLLQCPHCHAWHPVVGKPDATHDYARSLLYWDCEEMGISPARGGRHRAVSDAQDATTLDGRLPNTSSVSHTGSDGLLKVETQSETGVAPHVYDEHSRPDAASGTA